MDSDIKNINTTTAINATSNNNGASSSSSMQQRHPSNKSNMMTTTITTSNYDIDVLRLIGQHLVGMGLTQTVNLLLEESGLHGLDHPLATEFQRHILAGEWDSASSLLDELMNLVITTQQQQQQQQQHNQQQQQQQQPLISMQQNMDSIVTASSQHPATSLAMAESNGSTSATQATGCLSINGNAQAAQLTTTNTTNSANLEAVKIRSIQEMRLAIAEQKFLELVDDHQHLNALKCLRLELTPLSENVKEIQHLATLLMCKSNEEVRQKANWPGKGLQSRQMLLDKLSHYIPPPILLPPRRLSTLLDQAQQLQREHCILHIDHDDVEHQNGLPAESKPNTEAAASTMNGSNGIKLMNDGDSCTAAAAAPSSSPTSSATATKRYMDLKQDHFCSADKFPLTCRQELDSHDSEVWYCKFSNDGTKLATGGLGGKVKIWQLDPNERKLVEKCTLECNNSYSVACLSWSPNDVYLLACGSEDQPDLWLWNVNKEELHRLIAHTEEHQKCYTTCSWHLSGERFAAASTKGNITIFDMDGNEREYREGVRIQCIAFPHKDPDYILAADTLNRIKLYPIEDLQNAIEDDVLQEKNPIASFTIDKEDKYVAVNLFELGIHLWDLRLKTLLRIFPGVLQRTLRIYSSFASPGAPFLASGSEDGRIYIYHIGKDQPVAVLQGHSRNVNCVSWNSKYCELLASVGDDRTVRLWAPSTPQTTLKTLSLLRNQ